MKTDAVTVGLTATTITAGAALFDRVVPPAYELQDRPPTPQQTAYVRRQCAKTAALVLMLAGGVSFAVRSPWPFAGTAAVVGYLWHEYEAAARSSPSSSATSWSPPGQGYGAR